ncbi:MAG: HNH endonuclease [Actinomycetota bacterium]|nr:HNH endonuclease [Actinomycetota bacterium]
MDRDRLRACTSDDLTRSARQLAATLTATQAALLEIVAVIDEREQWRTDGCLSLEDWITFTFQVGRRTAHEWADAARALVDLPHLSAAFASGEISWDKTKAVAELASAESDEAMTAEAMGTDVKHLERAARKQRAISLQEANSRHRGRFLSIRRSFTMGGARLSGFLPDADAETLIKAIERLADDVPKDPDTGLYPRHDQRCADALIDMASQVLATQQPQYGERAMIVAHVDLSERGTEPRPDCASGMALAPETIERWMCDAVVEPVFEQGGRPIGVGRKRREPPQWLRRQLMNRDQGCRFPGCCRTRGLQAHHIDHWPGPTDPDNLVMLCRYHHRLMHEGGWSLRGDPDAYYLEFVNPAGQVLPGQPVCVDDAIKRRLIDRSVPVDAAGQDRRVAARPKEP